MMKSISVIKTYGPDYLNIHLSSSSSFFSYMNYYGSKYIYLKKRINIFKEPYFNLFFK